MEALTSRRLRPWRRFLRVHTAVVNHLARDMRSQHGLSLACFDVLAQLGVAGRLRMADLASRVLLSSSGLTRLLDRMETDGLIERRRCDEDRRGCWASLTPVGRRRLADVMPRHHDLVSKCFLQALDADDVRALDRILTKILETNQHPDKSALSNGSTDPHTASRRIAPPSAHRPSENRRA